MDTNLEGKIELFTIDNFNEATRIIFDRLYETSKLIDGDAIEGRIKHSDLKLFLYSEFFGFSLNDNQNWGEIAKQDIINFNEIEKFYKQIIEHLKKLSLVSNDFWNKSLEFSKEGYIEFSLRKAHGESPNYFKQKEPITLEEDELEKIILQKVYEYESMYNIPIFYNELAFRVINFLNPGFERFDSIHDNEIEKVYSNSPEIQRLLKSSVLKLYRRDLLFFNVRSSSKIKLTKRGRTFLSEGIVVINEEEKLPSLKTVKLLHITDLHFGSLEDAGVDNKDRMD